jgi:site-specific recombinase XerD
MLAALVKSYEYGVMNTTQAIQRLRDVIRRQHKALSTEESYVSWLRRYMAAIRQMPNSLPSEKKVECFLSDLARRRDVAASTQNQAFNAIAFFYKDVLGTPLQEVDAPRATRPAHLRHAPTVDETLNLMQSVRDVWGYATHCLERGTNPFAIQQAMGHKSLETTMGYLHAESLSVISPLDSGT